MDYKPRGFTVPASKFSENWAKLKQELQQSSNKCSKTDVNKQPGGVRKTKKKRKRPRNKGSVSATDQDQTDHTTDNNNNSDQQGGGALALDCEFVGVGVSGADDMLARVSVVNSQGQCLYDTHVRPNQAVVDWRTAVSGVRPANVRDAPEFHEVQEKVRELIANRLLVGHGLKHDLKVLNISHPKDLLRDTCKFKLFRTMTHSTKTPSLKRLAHDILGIQVQQDEHDSIQDARVAMQLYQMHKRQWKSANFAKRKGRRNKGTVK